jgi:uncharacterized protein YjbI with pentapeptide repeats
VLTPANLRRCLLQLGSRSFWSAHLITGISPDAKLTGGWLAGANWTGAVLAHKDLTGTNLESARLSRADLAGACLRGARLVRAQLDRARLAGADLTGADLRDANLCEADLTGADLRGANLTGLKLWGARGDHRTQWPAGFDVSGHGVEHAS